ncbi:transporter substrate-binding domain-containing protein [Gramella lutea]|uniref:Transporter substrate-binding domain-containing protein n=1 Tax=Christiangramia lutea TaxID=1607951 RepID=A0A9X1V072_9FLAO|nr:transporter substrate-binding domain-containing protein [Christiangramia lutea]MCH4821748.1 transporter substrate-binding domain-containing protein [Christiangramia lutea]
MQAYIKYTILLFSFFFIQINSGSSNVVAEEVNRNRFYKKSAESSPKKLKALVVYSSTSYFLYRGKTMGFEYELLERLANNLDRELEIVVSPNIDSLIPDLLAGKADLIAHGLAITQSRKEMVSFTDELYQASQVLVQKKPSNWRNMTLDEINRILARDPLDLVGETVTVRINSAYRERLEDINREIGGGIFLNVLDGTYSTDKIIEMVNNEELKYTVADDYLARINTSYMPDIDIKTVISTRQQIAWAVRPESKDLLNTLNQQLKRAKKKVDYYVIYNKYFKNRSYFKRRIRSPFYSLKNNQISEFDEIIKKEASRIGWDWRLLSSIIYQESRFDATAESWAGAVGLMQLMPETAKAHGLTNPTDPEANIRAGTTYLKQIYDHIEGIEDPDQRIKFTLASYNCGYGHVLDAKRLAQAEGLQSNKWDNNVELMVLRLSEPETYHRPEVKHGYVMGKETYNYVNDIFQRYEHYSNFIDF